MKKTFFYSFVPSKAEEQTLKANDILSLVTRSLIEIRDLCPSPSIHNSIPCWPIKRVLTHHEVLSGKLYLPFLDMFDHVFRYWNISMVRHVVLGYKVNVVVWDVTKDRNDGSPKRYGNEGFYVEMLPNDDYALVGMELFMDRRLKVGDEIGLCWDDRDSNFRFNLITPSLMS